MNLGARMAAWSGGLSAKSYVQSGLIGLWDGKENAGWGKHSTAATVWKDLIGKAGDFYTCTASHWGDNCYNFNGSEALQAPFKQTLSAITLEIVCSKSGNSFFGWNAQGTLRYGITQWGESSLLKRLYWGNGSSYVNTDIGEATESNLMNSLSVASNSSTGVFYGNGGYIKSDVTANARTVTVNRNIMLNGYMDVPYSAVALYGTSKIYCARVYSRDLTADEIAANWKVDKARFGLT